MKCYVCNGRLSQDRDVCPKCGADIRLYRKIIHASNQYYNLGLIRAKARDLTGAAECLRISLQLYKKNIQARNLLGLVYYEMGEAALALKEWVISKNLRHRGNIADAYIQDMRENRQALDSADHSIHKFNQALEYARTGARDMAIIQLKKVINVNSRMIKAYQLLALLYMEDQKYDLALETVEKCLEIDRGNPGALSYQRELQSYRGSRKKKPVGVAGELEREEVIIPVRMRDYGSYLSAAVYILAGFLLSLGILYYVVMPGAKEQYRQENQTEIAEYEAKYAALNAEITQLQENITTLEEEKQQDASAYQSSNDEITKLADAYRKELLVAQMFIDENYVELADQFAELNLEEVEDPTYQLLYMAMKNQVDNNLIERMYAKAVWAREHLGDREQAIAICESIITLNPSYDSAYFYAALSWQELNDTNRATEMYTEYINRFPNGLWIQEVRMNLFQIAPQVLSRIDAAAATPSLPATLPSVSLTDPIIQTTDPVVQTTDPSVPVVDPNTSVTDPGAVTPDTDAAEIPVVTP